MDPQPQFPECDVFGWLQGDMTSQKFVPQMTPVSMMMTLKEQWHCKLDDIQGTKDGLVTCNQLKAEDLRFFALHPLPVVDIPEPKSA